MRRPPSRVKLPLSVGCDQPGLTSPPAPFRVGIAPTDSFPKNESVNFRAAPCLLTQSGNDGPYPGGILAKQSANGPDKGADHHAIRQEYVGMIAQKIGDPDR